MSEEETIWCPECRVKVIPTSGKCPKCWRPFGTIPMIDVVCPKDESHTKRIPAHELGQHQCSCGALYIRASADGHYPRSDVNGSINHRREGQK